MKFDPYEIIPSSYFGREQAYIKHLLLRGYLERLLYIIGYSAAKLGHTEITYVDCFAGPWQDESDDLSATSIGISLTLLSKVQSDLAKIGRVVKFSAVYVEQNTRAFMRLKNFLSEGSPSNVRTTAIHGEFTAKIPDILAACPAKSFAFFFIDPKGWATIEPALLQSLLARPRSEFLVNFMYDFINRAVSMDALREKISSLFDRNVELKDIPASPKEREEYLLQLYRTAIVNRSSDGVSETFSAYVTILDPTIDRTKYHLIYLTRHSRGVLEFMKQSEQLAGIQSTVRTAAKVAKQNKSCGTADLFGIVPGQPEIPHHSNNQHRLARIESLWLSKLQTGELRVTEKVFATLICESNCFPSELQGALRSLILRGQVQNLDANVARRPVNVIDYVKQERLRLADTSC